MKFLIPYRTNPRLTIDQSQMDVAIFIGGLIGSARVKKVVSANDSSVCYDLIKDWHIAFDLYKPMTLTLYHTPVRPEETASDDVIESISRWIAYRFGVVVHQVAEETDVVCITCHRLKKKQLHKRAG